MNEYTLKITKKPPIGLNAAPAQSGVRIKFGIPIGNAAPPPDPGDLAALFESS